MPEIGKLKQVSQGSIKISKVDVAVINWEGDTYEGEYEVTPRWTEQSLETQGKTMMHDVTVHEIPVIRTTNPSGGITIVIG